MVREKLGFGDDYWNILGGQRYLKKKKKNTPSRLLKILTERLVKHGYTVSGKIERTYPGWNQRSAGAWVWFVYVTNIEGPEDQVKHTIGSQVSLTELCKLKEEDWVVGIEDRDTDGISIDPIFRGT